MRQLLGTVFMLLVLALTTPLAGAIPSRSEFATKADHSRELCLNMLDQAHQLSGEFSLHQRGWTVFEAAQVAAQIDPVRGKQWALEAWQLAKKFEPGQDRVALKKDALRELAWNDPDRALRLYKHLDLPSKWKAEKNNTEDARSLGYANTIFKPVWERGGHRYQVRLIKLAQYLGSTGQYPYGAMSKIALDIEKKGDSSYPGILQDASWYFQTDRGFVTTNKEFVRFILATRRIAARDLLQAELTTVVHALQLPPPSFAKQTWRITITTAVKTANFDSQNEALLFQLLPLIRRVMPELADTLLHQYPSLQVAAEISEDTPMILTASVSFEGTADTARMKERADESRVFRVESMADDAPKEALLIASEISDPYQRTRALLALAPAYSKVDAKLANEWLSDAKRSLAVSDDRNKLRLYAGLVQANAKLSKTAEAQALVPEAFALGEAAFTRDLKEHPDQLADSAEGFAELSTITESLVESESLRSAGIARLGMVHNEVLRAELLISAAKGMSQN